MDDDSKIITSGAGTILAPLIKHGSRESFSLNNLDSSAIEDRTRKKSVVNIHPSVVYTSSKTEVKDGLFNVRAMFFLVLWYFFSGCTLFLNKYILSYLDADPTILGKLRVNST